MMPRASESCFEKEGHRAGDYFETRKALDAERLVRNELNAAARRRGSSQARASS
jgi:hypothetical protein